MPLAPTFNPSTWEEAGGSLNSRPAWRKYLPQKTRTKTQVMTTKTMGCFEGPSEAQSKSGFKQVFETELWSCGC